MDEALNEVKLLLPDIPDGILLTLPFLGHYSTIRLGFPDRPTFEHPWTT